MGDIRKLDESMREEHSMFMFVDRMFENFSKPEIMQFMNVFNEKMKELNLKQES